MSHSTRKIINDPVYGFITLDHPLLLGIIAHPYYQRLRRIHQMAFAHLVYPGAVHTRLHHSLGAYHLMCDALSELKGKGVAISEEEELGAKVAILLHDAGHGPFSHALENKLITDVHHEDLSLSIMRVLNKELGGQLDTAIRIFTNDHPKRFLHQLISGQLDTDRMDYLTRDSFFTGVSEGVIGYDRILKMLTVHDGELMVEEKAIFTIEKFLVSRRLMYWQVYLHKTVLSAEKMLVKIIERAKELIAGGKELHSSSPILDFFLKEGRVGGGMREGNHAGIKKAGIFQESNLSDGSKDGHIPTESYLDKFCLLDDYDVMSTIKNWMFHPDKILSQLSRFLIDRRLLKARFQVGPIEEKLVAELREKACKKLGISEEEASYFVFTGETTNTTYDPSDEMINILFKDGSVKDISKVDNALVHQTLSRPVKKFYICYLS